MLELNIEVVHRDLGRGDPTRPSDPGGPTGVSEALAFMSSCRQEFEIVNRLGLHARAATRLVQLACQYPCEISVSREGQSANAKSVMGVLLLCGAQGTMIEVSAEGDQAKEAVAALGRLIADRFGEGQ